jgi:hypothetical protein
MWYINTPPRFLERFCTAVEGPISDEMLADCLAILESAAQELKPRPKEVAEGILDKLRAARALPATAREKKKTIMITQTRKFLEAFQERPKDLHHRLGGERVLEASGGNAHSELNI